MTSTLEILWKHETDLSVWKQAEKLYDRFFRTEQQRLLELEIEKQPQILTQPHWENHDWFKMIHEIIIPWYLPLNFDDFQHKFSNANRNQQALNQQVNQAVHFCLKGITTEDDIYEAITRLTAINYIGVKTATAILTALFPEQFCIFSKHTEEVMRLTGEPGIYYGEDLDKAVYFIQRVRQKSEQLKRYRRDASDWQPIPRKIEKALFALRDDDPNTGLFTLQQRFNERVEASVISTEFPLPIARVFHQIEYIHELAEVLIVSNILFAFLHYLASVFIMDYLSSDFKCRELNDLLFNREEHQSFGRPLSIGGYAHWIRKIIKEMKKKGFPFAFPELVSLYVTHSHEMDQLIAQRNNMIKKKLVIEDLRVLLPVYKSGLIELLEAFQCLRSYPVMVQDAQTPSPQQYRAMGWETLFPQEVSGVESPTFTSCMVLKPDQNTYLSLYPFYLYTECKETGCSQNHLFYLSFVDSKNKYIQYYSPEGHELRDKQAFLEPVQLMGATCASDLAVAVAQ